MSKTITKRVFCIAVSLVMIFTTAIYGSFIGEGIEDAYAAGAQEQSKTSVAKIGGRQVVTHTSILSQMR